MSPSSNTIGETWIDIKTLPQEHQLRNTQLKELAGVRYKVGLSWKTVLPAYGIAKATFNQLSDVWTQHEWQIQMVVTINKAEQPTSN